LDRGVVLPFWHALSLWRLAVTVEGILRRVRDDPRNAGTETVSTDMVDAIAQKAHEVAAAAGI
jgi:hypothetical protein